ncbi:MAG: UDP-N-acetylmuramoyl-L-alanyl-D-glutamate--2,6-diaminopimelate ligase [Ignavibacteria bacterium]
MKLSEISEKIRNSSLKYEIEFSDDVEITGLCYDSRIVKPGDIFFAVKGLISDGNKFIKEAIERGAVIVFTDDDNFSESEMPVIKVDDVRKIMALMSGIFYEDPSSKLKLIGVTGTNGKTTTAYLMHALLSNAGYKTGLIGTIECLIGNEKIESKLTTPDSVELNMILNKMVNEKTEFCVMEVSSIALSMERVYGLKFDTAVFTNLTSEHLDFHKDMENYFEAKKILFDNLDEDSNSVSNKDDEYGQRILSETKAKKIFYSVDKVLESDEDLKADDVKLGMDGINFNMIYRGENVNISSDLAGRFNVYNILASAGTVLNYNVSLESITEVLNNFSGVTGRFNRIPLPNGAVAVIDYSHTSDSLKNAIEAAKEIIKDENKNGSLITIFGCGGNKDRFKRPVMGKYATELSDFTIITSDNPRFEEPMDIIEEIKKGISEEAEYKVIENREEAIKAGIGLAVAGDIILICGKGHETYQEIKGVRSHFDDKEIVLKYQNLSLKNA